MTTEMRAHLTEVQQNRERKANHRMSWRRKHRRAMERKQERIFKIVTHNWDWR